MNSTQSFSQRLSFNLISLSIICLALVYGKVILLPILFSILLASLLLPLSQFLAKKNFYKPLSILLPLILAIVVCAGVVYFLSSQVGNFAKDMPMLKEKVGELSHSAQDWVNQHLHIPEKKQNQYIDSTVEDIKEKAPTIMGVTFASLTSMISYIVLIPVYTFLILYYRSTIKTFLIESFKNGSKKRINDVLVESTTISQRYLTGLLIETTIVFTLNTIGFLVLGIKYPILLALTAALLNLIPYVGMLVANVLCILITLVTAENMSDALWVAAILALVQFLDNNFGMPLVVGNQVRLNGLVTIIGILVGGTLCGIPGMFLAIPGLAFLKVIFDKVPELNHWGGLLGDTPSEPIRLRRKTKAN